ncbi:hypothetical protein XENOCAPTIV_026322, partial [Xenoophorus captivus]
SLVVANGGLGNGVSREDLFAAVNQFGDVESLLMPPQKPYAFVTYRYDRSKSLRFIIQAASSSQERTRCFKMKRSNKDSA